MKKKRFNLQLFDDGGGAGSDGQSGGAGNGSGGQTNTGATYSYDQAEEIANARANKAERAALAGYFKSQGMTEEQVTTAIADFKAKQQAQQPNVSQITQERDDALKKIAQYENEKLLTQAYVGTRIQSREYRRQ